MGRRHTLLLLLLLCAFASFVSAQTISVTFLDEWREETSRVLQQSKVLLRVIDPAADTTAGRDSVSVGLSSVNGEDVATANLAESGDATGVFEGEVFLTTDFALDNIYGVDADQLYTTWIYDPDPTLDTATATYGGASDSVEVGLSEARLVDGEGRGTETVTLGQPVRVRVRDAYADRSTGPDLTTATLTTSGGGSQVVTLTETGARTHTFEGSSDIQTAIGETVTVTHAETATGTTSSSDTATVARASVSFLRPRDGRTTDFVLADSAIVARVIDVSLNLDPAAVESLVVSISLMLSGDSEVMTLRETGPDTGVFEGKMHHAINFFYRISGDGLLVSGTGSAQFQPDTVRVQHEVSPFADAQAPLTLSIIRLVDEDGADAESFALGSELRVQVETAMNTGPSLDVQMVQVRSLATGDLETLRTWETDGRPCLFVRALPIVPGAAVPGDGKLQAQPGETVEVEHEVDGIASSDQATVARSAVRFVDEAGLPLPVLLEETTARVRVLDPLSAGQVPATIRSRITRDTEPLSLAELPASPGVFEGSIPMSLWAGGSGVLATGREYPAASEPDMITASDGEAAAMLLMVPAVLEVLDGQDEPRTFASAGDTLRIRATAPRADVNTYPEYLAVLVSSREFGHSQWVFLTETGGSTGIFEGPVATARAGVPTSEPVLYVETADTVEVVYNASTYPDDPTGRVVTVVAIVPVAVELLDDQGEATESYLFGDTIHVRVAEADANTNPATAETLTAKVIARRYGDAKLDLETVTLTETGPDTGVFTGTLPTAVLPGFSDSPVLGNGLAEFQKNHQEPDSDSMVTAYRSGVSATARVRDSKLWLADGQGRDATVFPLGSTVHVWFRRPASNVSSGIDSPVVRIRTLKISTDSEDLILIETGEDTGLFTASILTQQGTSASGNGVLNGQTGDAFEASFIMDHAALSSVLGYLGEPLGSPPLNNPPQASDDFATTDEDMPVNVAVKANDTDPDGDPLTVVSVTQGANGSSAIEGDGSVTYTPKVNFSGSDSFTYTISAEGGTDTGTVYVIVHAVNDPPVAVDDAITTNEDVWLNITVVDNDTDVDGDSLIVTAVTQGAKGSVVINMSPSVERKKVIYTPNANANGSDSFTYTVSDGTGGSGGTATATVFMTITPVNDVPKAFADVATTSEDTPVTLDPRINDTDVDGDSLTVTFASNPNRGSTVINADSTATYTPDANLNGNDSFLYTISDGQGGTWSATVSVTVTPVNDAPVANNDIPPVQEDTPVTINVLSNDSDIDGDILTVTLLTQPAHGTAVLNPNKTVTYTPNPNFSGGTDTFTYSVSDGNGGTDPATVFLNVIPVNDPPVAVADSATVAEEGTVTIPVIANDTDAENSALTLTAVTQGAHGTVTIVSGQARYQPAANYSGSDTFTYTIRDTASLTSVGTVSVTVTPVNDPPVAVADSAATNEDAPVTVSVLGNDTDVDGDILTVVAVTQSANGSVATNGTTLTFTPAANFSGTATFTYTARDAGGVERTANVTVTVNPVNDPPLAGADSAVTNESTPVTVSVLANDADIDGGALSVNAVTQGSNGAVATNGVTATYTPVPGFSGTDSFTYNVSDGFGGTATGLVTVTVNEVNGVPVANPDSGATREGVPVIIAVLANDTDADGDTLTVTAVGSPGVLLPDNTVRYTPGANFTGTVTFSYTVSDDQGGTATGQVTVVVGEALERVAILATNSAWLRTGSDVLSGDVIVNRAGTGPFLNGAELSIAGSVTTAANWDVEADSLTVAAGAVVGGDISYNQLTNGGTINGLQRSPLALPIFPTLPTFLTATPGSTNINVSTNGTRTLAPGSYLDLVVGRKGTVTFTGGVYHFRSITVDREAKLLFSAASQVRVQQKLSTKNLTRVGPATGASIDASSILFYVAGINGTTGALTATPKAVDIGTNNTVSINLYAPNGTAWLQDGTLATGAFLGKDIDVGLNVQVTLDSAF